MHRSVTTRCSTLGTALVSSKYLESASLEAALLTSLPNHRNIEPKNAIHCALYSNTAVGVFGVYERKS